MLAHRRKATPPVQTYSGPLANMADSLKAKGALSSRTAAYGSGSHMKERKSLMDKTTHFPRSVEPAAMQQSKLSVHHFVVHFPIKFQY
jgi:hypothetical protein